MPWHGTPGFLAHRGLLAAAAGGALAEASLLVVVAPAARGLAPQATALPPLAVFHDLRWLYAYQHSWPGFVLFAVVIVLVRAAVNTALTRLSWPRDLPAPGLTGLLRAGLAVTALACLLLAPLVTLTFGVALVPFSWPFLGLLPVMLLIAIPLCHGVVPSWWRMLPPPAAMLWLLADFAVLSVTAALAIRLPAAAAVPLAGLAGLANGRAWLGVTAAMARRTALGPAAAHTPPWPHIRWMPVAPVSAAVVLAAVVVILRLLFVASAAPAARAGASPRPAHGTGQQEPASPATPVDHQGQTAILKIPGFGSACCGRQPAPPAPGTFVQQFSYRGISRSGQPLPYGKAASNLPLPVLGNLVAEQVRRLHDETGRPVDIIAESEGALGVDAMLATHPRTPVGSVVLLSPIIGPGQVSYPAAAAAGIGWLPGRALHAVVWFIGGLSPFGSSGAQTFINSVNSVGARFAVSAARHRPLRWLAIVPLADAVTLPVCSLPRNVIVVSGFHGDLLGNPAALRLAGDFLAGRDVRPVTALRSTAELVAAASTAWRMPQLTSPPPPCA